MDARLRRNDDKVLCRLFYHSDLYATDWNDGMAG